MVNGTVTLSLAEVDLLRNTIKEHEERIEELNKELYETIADRRILKITKKVPVRLNESCVSVDVNKICRIAGWLSGQRSGLGYSNMHSNEIAQQVLDCITSHPSVSKDDETKEFINMDDVLTQAREKAEESVKWDLESARRYRKDAEAQVSTLKETFDDRVAAEAKPLRAQIQNLNGVVSGLEQEVDDLRNNRKRLNEIETLENRIADLMAELEKEKSKKWYQKL